MNTFTKTSVQKEKLRLKKITDRILYGKVDVKYNQFKNVHVVAVRVK